MSNKIKLLQTAKEICERGDIRLSASDKKRIDDETKDLLRRSMFSRSATKAPKGFGRVLAGLRRAKSPDEAFSLVAKFLIAQGVVEDVGDALENLEDAVEGIEQAVEEVEEAIGEEGPGDKPEKKPEVKFDEKPEPKKDLDEKVDGKPEMKLDDDKGDEDDGGEEDVKEPEFLKNLDEKKEAVIRKAQGLDMMVDGPEKKPELKKDLDEKGKGKPDLKKLKDKDKRDDSKKITEDEMGMEKDKGVPGLPGVMGKFKVQITPEKNIVAYLEGKGPLFYAVPNDEIKKDAEKLRRTANKVYGLVIYDGPKVAAAKCGAKLLAGVDDDIETDSVEEVPAASGGVTDGEETDTSEERETEPGTILEDSVVDTEEKPDKVVAIRKRLEQKRKARQVARYSKVKKPRKTSMWKDQLQSVYTSIEELESYDEIYGILDRLGFDTAEEAWEANPMIQGSTNPADFGLAKEGRKRSADTILDGADDEVQEEKAVSPATLDVTNDGETDIQEARPPEPGDALSDGEVDFQSVEANYKKLYAARAKKQAAQATEKFVNRFTRCMRIASRRMMLNHDDNPLKAAAADILTSNEVNFTNGEVFVPMDMKTAAELIELISSESHDKFVDHMLNRTADLMEKGDSYLNDLEKDIENLAPASVEVEETRESPRASRKSSRMRRAASAGNFDMNVSGLGEAPRPEAPGDLRDAIGNTKVSRISSNLRKLAGGVR